jgi:AraC-like DNA-binding protein
MSDYFHADLEALVRLAGTIPEKPADYYIGLPDPPWTAPSNILCFTRHAPFSERIGSVHHRFVLCISLQGAASVMVDEEVVRIESGTGLLVFPHQFHLWTDFAEGQTHWLLITFELADADALQALRGRLLPLNTASLGLVRLVAEQYATLQGRRIAIPIITHACALLLSILLQAVARDERGRPEPSRARKIMQTVAQYVHQNLSTSLRLPDVARASGISESHLRARFRALTGIALGEYIRRVRLHRARVLLRGTALSVKEIADRCGYTSIYTFSRAFRAAHGSSPTTYRQLTPVSALTQVDKHTRLI